MIQNNRERGRINYGEVEKVNRRCCRGLLPGDAEPKAVLTAYCVRRYSERRRVQTARKIITPNGVLSYSGGLRTNCQLLTTNSEALAQNHR